jgi:hypothetical protein
MAKDQIPMTHEERVEHLLSTLLIQNNNLIQLVCALASMHWNEPEVTEWAGKISKGQRDILRLAIGMANQGSVEEQNRWREQYEAAVAADQARPPIGFGK